MPIELQRSWVDRQRQAPSPLARILARDMQAVQGSDILPLAHRTALPPDHAAYLRGAGGQYPLGGQLVRQARQLSDAADETPAAPERVHAIANRSDHKSFLFHLPASGAELVVLPEEHWRSYLLIVDEGAGSVRVSFGGVSADEGTPFDQDGYVELQTGTVGEVRAKTTDGSAATLAVTEGFYYPYPDVRQPHRRSAAGTRFTSRTQPRATTTAPAERDGEPEPDGEYWLVPTPLGRTREWIPADEKPPAGAVPAGHVAHVAERVRVRR